MRWRGLDSDGLLALHRTLPAAPLRIADTLAAPEPLRGTLAQLFGARYQEIASLVVVPVSHARVPNGALLIVAHADVSVLSARDESALSGLSAQAATAIENARLYGEAEGLIRALAQSNRELDQFAYVASHDLKAPLRGIAHVASWLEEDLGTTLPERSLEHLRLLRTRVTRLERMINGILHYSRAGRSDQDEPVDVSELLQEVVALLHVPAQAEVRVGAMPLLLTERVPLQQVFMNLIGNALKYAKRPDVRVDVGCADEDDGFLRFSVRDNGPGVAPESRERIWQIFAARSSDSESTGIGLAVVRKTVEARGGRAWVESTPQHGATFHFTWPRRLAQGAQLLSHGTATTEH
jgi:signal transduction histidine kinase